MMKEEFEKRLHESALQIYTEGYEEGLEDAWECARKIILRTDKGGIDAKDLFKIFDIRSASGILESVSINEAMQKIKEYERQKQKCEDCFTEKLTEEKWASAKDCKKCTKKISAECVVDGCEFEPKQDEKNCRNCGQPRDYKNRCIPFIEGKCIVSPTRWIPKQTDATDSDEIKVGDEVSCPQIDSKGIVIQTANKNTLLVLTNSMDGLLRTDESKVARTGRHFDAVTEILRQLRGDK